MELSFMVASPLLLFFFFLEGVTSLTRDQTCTPVVKTWCLNHWIAREVLCHCYSFPFATVILDLLQDQADAVEAK